MKRIVAYKTKNGKEILVEVDLLENEVEKTDEGMILAARDRMTIIREAKIKFEEAFDTVKPVAESIFQEFQMYENGPNQVSVEFGLKMNVNSGVIITSGGIETNFKVTLLWNKITN